MVYPGTVQVPSGGGGGGAAPAAGGAAPAAAAEAKEEEKKEEKVRSRLVFFYTLSDLLRHSHRKSPMMIWASVCSIRIKLYRCNATIFPACT